MTTKSDARLHLVSSPCDSALDYLYGELSGAPLEAFVAHLAGCASCQATVESWGRVRTAVKESAPVAALPEARMQAMHAQLMLAAAQERPMPAVTSIWARARRVANAPVAMAAMTIVIVGGAIAFNWSRGRMQMPAATPSVTAGATTTPPPPPPPQIVAAPETPPAEPLETKTKPPLATKADSDRSVFRGGKAGPAPDTRQDDTGANTEANRRAQKPTRDALNAGLLAKDLDLKEGGQIGTGHAEARPPAVARNVDDAFYAAKKSAPSRKKELSTLDGVAASESDTLGGLSSGSKRAEPQKRPAQEKSAGEERQTNDAEPGYGRADKSSPVVPKVVANEPVAPATTPTNDPELRGATAAAPAPVAEVPVQHTQQHQSAGGGGAPKGGSLGAGQGQVAQQAQRQPAKGKQQKNEDPLTRADSLADSGQCDAAQKLFAQANANDSTRSRLALVRCLRHVGRYREAQASLDALKAAKPAAAVEVADEQRSLSAAKSSEQTKAKSQKTAAPAATQAY